GMVGGHGGRAWWEGMVGGHGGRAWWEGMVGGHGGRAWPSRHRPKTPRKAPPCPPDPIGHPPRTLPPKKAPSPLLRPARPTICEMAHVRAKSPRVQTGCP